MMSGLCNSDSSGIEAMQWRALNATVRELLPCGTTTNSKWAAVVDRCHGIQNYWLEESKQLGGFAKNGQTSYISSYVHKLGRQYGVLQMTLNIIQGTA
jgi:hypothetical protein